MRDEGDKEANTRTDTQKVQILRIQFGRNEYTSTPDNTRSYWSNFDKPMN